MTKVETEYLGANDAWLFKRLKVQEMFDALQNNPAPTQDEINELLSAAVRLVDFAWSPTDREEARALVKQIKAFIEKK